MVILTTSSDGGRRTIVSEVENDESSDDESQDQSYMSLVIITGLRRFRPGSTQTQNNYMEGSGSATI